MVCLPHGKQHYKWMTTLVPISAISGGLGIFIPLYIIYLNGNVFDVGIAFALYNLVSIPSSIIWGRLTDNYKKNKPFIMLSLLLTLPVLLGFILFQGLYNSYIYYSLYAVIATAASPAINILVMGTKRSRSLPRYFSRYAIFNLIGSITAFGFGILTSEKNPFIYLYILLGLNVIAILLAYFLIKDERLDLPENEIKKANGIFPLLNTLTSLPNIFVGSSMIKRVHNAILNVEKKRIYQLLGAIVLFNIGYYLFNTSYIPYLKIYGLSYSSIFTINLVNSIAQIAIFIYIIKIKRGMHLNKLYTQSIFYRSSGYAIAILAVFVPGFFFATNIISYMIAGFAYAIWNLSSSVLLYDIVRGSKAGYYVGVWTGLLGGSAVFGALLSGVLSTYISYTATFLIAIVFTIFSGLLFAKNFNHKTKIK